jgi:hypothetical protein
VYDDESVDPAFAGATAGQTKEFIDFDSDDLVSFGAIPSDKYAAQGISLVGLDARDVSPNPWTHSPPFGAQQAGYNTASFTGSYSFVFTEPVASVGLFANDVEAVSVSVVVHTEGGGTQSFELPTPAGPTGASITNFYGFVASENAIEQVDFSSLNLHVIDDVQFGQVPGATTTSTTTSSTTTTLPPPVPTLSSPGGLLLGILLMLPMVWGFRRRVVGRSAAHRRELA